MSFEYLINNVRNMRSYFFDNIWNSSIIRYEVKHHPQNIIDCELTSEDDGKTKMLKSL